MAVARVALDDAVCAAGEDDRHRLRALSGVACPASAAGPGDDGRVRRERDAAGRGRARAGGPTCCAFQCSTVAASPPKTSNHVSASGKLGRCGSPRATLGGSAGSDSRGSVCSTCRIRSRSLRATGSAPKLTRSGCSSSRRAAVGHRPVQQPDRMEQRAHQNGVRETRAAPTGTAAGSDRCAASESQNASGGDFSSGVMSSSSRVRRERAEAGFGKARSQHLEILLEHSRRRRLRDQVPQLGDRLNHERIEIEAEPRAEDRRAEHANGIFDEADPRIADRPDDALLEIAQPADVVDDRFRRGVVEQRVDREVAAERVFFGRAERVVAMRRVWLRARLGCAAPLRMSRRPPSDPSATGSGPEVWWSAGTQSGRASSAGSSARRRRGLRHHDGFGPSAASAGSSPGAAASASPGDVLAERRDLDGLGAELDVRQAEPPADDPAVPEEPS